MNLLYSLTLTVTSPIEGDLKPGLDEKDITPGLLGFLATLFLALCIVFLIRDMVKRIRRVRYRAQVAGEGEGTDFPAGPGDEAAQDAAVDAVEVDAADSAGAQEAAGPKRSESNPGG